MAVGSFIGVTPGAGAKLATGPTYTENANVVQDEKVILGENYLAGYTVQPNANLSTATAASHLLQIMAGASLKVRIRRIEMHQTTAVTTATLMNVLIFRLTSAGTGGTAITPTVVNPADGASGATAMTLPTVKGTEAASPMYHAAPYMIQTIGASTPFNNPCLVWDFDRARSQPLIIAAGAANGIAIKNEGAVAAGTVRFTVWFDETSF